MKHVIAQAKIDLDAVFGSNYAKANPALVAAYLYADALHEIDATLVEAVKMLADVGKNTLFTWLKSTLKS